MAEAKCVLWLREQTSAPDAVLAHEMATRSEASGYSTQEYDATAADSRRMVDEIANLLARHQVVVVNAHTRPPRGFRDHVGRAGSLLIEVCVRSSADACEPGDEQEAAPDIIMPDDAATSEKVVDLMAARLQEAGARAASASGGYSEDEEEEIRRRLEDLGYI